MGTRRIKESASHPKSEVEGLILFGAIYGVKTIAHWKVLSFFHIKSVPLSFV